MMAERLCAPRSGLRPRRPGLTSPGAGQTRPRFQIPWSGGRGPLRYRMWYMENIGPPNGRRPILLLPWRKAFNMALFRKSPEIFGLDIGSSGVKAVYLEESGGSYTLTAFGLAPLPPDAIADGTIKDPRTVVEAIRGAVSRAGLKGSSC